MVNASTAALPAEEMYDPDNPPEDRGFLGKLTVSVHVDGSTVTPTQGGDDARIVEQCSKYAEKATYSGPIWYLEAEGIDVVRSDGQPFRQRDIIKLKSSKGANLGGKQAPDLVATHFRDLGVTASYSKVGTDDSAVGRIFQFANHDLKLGGGFTKPVKLYAKEIMDKDFVFSGEPRVVQARAAEGEGAPATPQSTLSEDETISLVVSTLTGKTPAQMMDAVLAVPSLATVSTVFGVALLASATDETLSGVLVENKAMVLDGEGRLQPAA